MTHEEYMNLIANKLNSELKVREYYNQFNTQDLKFIDIHTSELSILEKDWSDFNMMTKPFRRKSDWIQLEYLGITNEEIYNVLKSWLLNSPIYDEDLITPDNIEQDVEPYDDTVLIGESTFIPAGENIDFDALASSKDFAKEVLMAEEWSNETGLIIMSPVLTLEDLEKKWEAFNCMTHKHRRVSDWKCLELFKMTNQQLYMYEKSYFLKHVKDSIYPENIESESDNDINIPLDEMSLLKKYYSKAAINESGCELARSLTKLLCEKTLGETRFNTIITKSIIEKTITDFNNINQNSLNVQINYSDMPMFTPDEMIDMGVFGHEPIENYFYAVGDSIISGDDTVLEWFNKYRQVYYGLPIDEEFNRINLERVRKLDKIYRTTTVEQRVADPALCQHIIEMGWNPMHEFEPVTRVKCDMRINSLIENGFGSSRIIDLRGFKTLDLSKFAISEESYVVTDGDFLKPIYIVFEEGSSAFSYSIKKITHGIYSHAAISFDSSMEKMYSYNLHHTEGKFGGFSIESIKNSNKEKQIGIYTVFVDNKVWDTIYNNVMHFIENAKQTTYSFANILTIIFKIPYEKNNSLICSQFVDRMLKLGGIDVTGKSSSLVDPNFLHKASKASKNIYKLYTGKVKYFKPKLIYDRTYGILNKISKYKSGAISKHPDIQMESLFFYNSLNALNEIYERYEDNKYFDETMLLRKIYETFYVPCMEAKEIPIRFDGKGDIIINPFPIDYKSEYAKSHKLLMEYDKSKNYEGMKSELAKLWMMYITIEKKLRRSQFNKRRVKYLQDAKALILNDFKKYLKTVVDNEKGFDFEDYYLNSKYSDGIYKLDKNTVKHTIDMIKTII